MTVRLTGLEVEGFRGFARATEARLDADAVVVVGSNGTGKTSLVDAICWGLTGRLPHLESRRSRQNDEVVVSAYRQGTSARVVVHMVADGVRVHVDRTGTSFSSTVAVTVEGEVISAADGEAELRRILGAADEVELQKAVDRWVLRQEEIREILQAPPPELHDRLRGLLGLGVLDGFEEALSKVAESRTEALKAARTELRRAEEELQVSRRSLAEVDERLGRSTDLKPAVDALIAVAQSSAHLVTLDVDALQKGDYGLALAQLRAIYEPLRVATIEIPRLLTEQPVATASHEIAEPDNGIAESEAAQLALDLVARRAALHTLERQSESMVTLISVALPLLADQCPICEQEIDKAVVEARLKARLESAGGLAIVEARAAVDELARQSAEAETRLRHRHDERKAQAGREAERDRYQAEIDSRWKGIETGASVFALRVNVERDVSLLAPTMDAIVELGQALRAVVASSQASNLASERNEYSARVEAAEAAALRARTEVEVAARQATEAAALLKAARNAAVRVVSRAMEAVNPRFSDVYRRLAPHPTFTDLSFSHDYYRSKGRSIPTVHDPLWHVDANPSVVCSVGQLNVVALSYFLAFAMAGKDDRMPFVILDDPFQSLDDVNALGFADFCRRLKLDRQVIVTTHDARFGDLLRRKLAPRLVGEDMLSLDMIAWDRDGPRMRIQHSTGASAATA